MSSTDSESRMKHLDQIESQAKGTANTAFDHAERMGRQMHRARQLLAYGGLDGVMNRPLLHEDGLYPHFAVHAEGYELTDSSGQKYIDWINGWGSIFLGHGYPAVKEAIINQVEHATSIALMHPVEIEVAELIVEMVPCAEKVAFGKNGSDALNGAIRIARAATGRELILHNGFHGFHDWYTCQFPHVQGILRSLKNYIHEFPYNDLSALEALLNEYRDQVAAVVMEPVNMYLPEEGYLQAVKDLVHQHGGVLIWDEVVTAFRLGRGGAQQYFGVEPDIAVLGKAMGNGMPLSAITGPARLMEYLPRTAYGMTYRGETISLAAAQACLGFAKTNDVAGHLDRIGSELRSRFHLLCERYNIGCKLAGPPARMTFVFQPKGQMNWNQLRSVFVLECIKNGVLTNGNILVSFAHDEEAINRTLDVFEIALQKLRGLIDAAGDSRHAGSDFAHDAGSIQVKGCIDTVVRSPKNTIISGWALVDGAVVDSWHAALEDGQQIQAEVNPRPDIEEAFPNVENGVQAGFKFTIGHHNDGSKQRRFRLTARIGKIERFHCLVVDDSTPEKPAAKGPYWFRDGILFI